MEENRLARTTSADPDGSRLLKKIKDVPPAIDEPEAIIRFRSTISRIYHSIEEQWVEGTGQEARFIKVDKGWFIGLADSYESLAAGMLKPKVEVGQVVTVVIYPGEFK